MNHEKGVGLAANQIGVSKSIFIIKQDEGIKVFINPELLSQSNPVPFEEGCLSIPGALGTTERFNNVVLRYTDSSGNRSDETFEGFQAIAIQHEMDHLNGVLYVDHMGPVKKMMTINKHKKFLRLTRK